LAYKSKKDEQLNLTEDTAGTQQDAQGYRECYVHLIPTDVSGTPDILIQTSNKGGTTDANWITLTTVAISDTTQKGYDTAVFGRYLRCYADLTTGETLGYVAYYEFKA